MLFTFTTISGKFLHSRCEREFVMITSVEEKIASTVNDKQFSHIIIHEYKWGNTMKIQQQTFSKYIYNLHIRAVLPMTNKELE